MCEWLVNFMTKVRLEFWEAVQSIDVACYGVAKVPRDNWFRLSELCQHFFRTGGFSGVPVVFTA